LNPAPETRERTFALPLLNSWIESANAPGCPFPLNNLPYGVFSVGDGDLR